ncbi:hypothetical protein LINPERHAP1_LOCUS26050, partial [Linum perenne]
MIHPPDLSSYPLSAKGHRADQENKYKYMDEERKLIALTANTQGQRNTYKNICAQFKHRSTLSHCLCFKWLCIFASIFWPNKDA